VRLLGQQRFEGVEELLLRALLAGDELDVVDEQQIEGAIFRAKLAGAVIADGIDEVVGEALGGEIEQAPGGVAAGARLSGASR
jgi:hypothetical protein